jgi:hypothetical protein
MIGFPLMRALALALTLSCAVATVASPSLAQAPAATAPVGQIAYPAPLAAVEALADAVRRDDTAQMRKLFGDEYRKLVPTDAGDGAALRKTFIETYDKGRKVVMDGDAKAILEMGDKGWTFPVPLVRSGDGWRFDIVAGADEIRDREIGRNELAVMQVLLAIVDAQQEYFAADPMKTGAPHYARRLLSTPGKKDGLYWEGKPGEAESPLGELVAHAQADGAARAEGYHGYHFRLLYAQGPNAPGGAYDYLVKGRMLGGFAVIAWPVRYGETGVMTFMVSHDGVVYEKDLGAGTAAAAGQIAKFDPDKSWSKADTTP